MVSIGLIKVKNESVAAALDAIVELQHVDLKSNLTSSHTGSNLQVVIYECTSCTYLNPDGKAVCDVCGTAAPHCLLHDIHIVRHGYTRAYLK